jgi:hypothetical protein
LGLVVELPRTPTRENSLLAELAPKAELRERHKV